MLLRSHSVFPCLVFTPMPQQLGLSAAAGLFAKFFCGCVILSQYVARYSLLSKNKTRRGQILRRGVRIDTGLVVGCGAAAGKFRFSFCFCFFSSFFIHVSYALLFLRAVARAHIELNR